MTCTNTSCLYWITCQKKHKPCPGNAARTRFVRNGYAVMAVQEYAMRDSSIEFKGDF